MLFPRYITIPRGQLLVELLGFAICPWKIMASATTFTTFLSGYGLFMASVVAIMVCDYFLLTNGNVFLTHLYFGTRDNKHYYYHRGWNVQALLAYLVGIALPVPGFIGTLGPSVSATATKLGHLGWMLSFVSSFCVYYALCRVWPTKNQELIRKMGLQWEEMGNHDISTTNGVVITEEVGRSSESEVALPSKGEKHAVAESVKSM
jgi:NCS1 family nucleobase:cation symporter-1